MEFYGNYFLNNRRKPENFMRNSNLTSGLSGKANSNHAHTYSSITGKPNTFPPASHNHDSNYLPKSTLRVDNTCAAIQSRDSGDGNTHYCLNSGIYAIGPTDTGNPAKTYGVMLVINTSQTTGNAASAWIKQIFFPNGSPSTIYIRDNINYTAAGWSSWAKYTGV